MDRIRKKKKLNQTIFNLVVDTGLAGVFALVYDPDNTGLFLHEWLGVWFAAAIVGHILLHWKWVVAATKRFFGRLAKQARINYLLNTLLFIDITAIIFTGLMISEWAVPGLGSLMIPSRVWLSLHVASASAAVGLIFAHVALHWKWLFNIAKRYVLKPVVRLGTTVPQQLQFNTNQNLKGEIK